MRSNGLETRAAKDLKPKLNLILNANANANECSTLWNKRGGVGWLECGHCATKNYCLFLRGWVVCIRTKNLRGCLGRSATFSRVANAWALSVLALWASRARSLSPFSHPLSAPFFLNPPPFPKLPTVPLIFSLFSLLRSAMFVKLLALLRKIHFWQPF